MGTGDRNDRASLPALPAARHVPAAGGLAAFAAAHNRRGMIAAGTPASNPIVSVSHPHPSALRPPHGARRGRTPSKPGGATAQVQSLTRGLSILECLAR